ncbi:hypothetical protein [Methylobacterium tarhaniae]
MSFRAAITRSDLGRAASILADTLAALLAWLLFRLLFGVCA